MHREHISEGAVPPQVIRRKSSDMHPSRKVSAQKLKAILRRQVSSDLLLPFDVLRRFERGWEHFVRILRLLADEWAVYDNSGKSAKLLERWPWKSVRRCGLKKPDNFAAGVGRGLRLAARAARKVARAHGTPIYVWENGKEVAKQP